MDDCKVPPNTQFRSGQALTSTSLSSLKIVLGELPTSSAMARILRPSERSRPILATSFGSASSALGRPPTRP